MKQTVLNLTGLEIFFIFTTLISLFINLYQLMRSRRDKAALVRPLLNSLIALFNDVKAKTTSVQGTQQFLFHQLNPHKDITTLRWEYWRFAEFVNDFLKGFQEILVGALVSLNPKDKDGHMAFKAADYGLSEEDKARRNEWMQRYHKRQLETLGPQQQEPAQEVSKEESGHNQRVNADA